uniref:Uncharacterized protein n=1 Tax=uncultured marine virus TaxID=186617 RepID=A0A0F7LAC1_9VIRU|nr:hypothetical protein [uncultured marine virus]
MTSPSTTPSVNRSTCAVWSPWAFAADTKAACASTTAGGSGVYSAGICGSCPRCLSSIARWLVRSSGSDSSRS